MKSTILVAVCTILLAPTASAHDDHSKAECEKTQQKIKKLESRMRQGYTRAQGEKWSDQLRMLRANRFKQCR